MYLPLILIPAFRNVNSTPILLSIIFFLVVINDSKEILYIVRFSMYPLVSFLIKSLGKSIANLLRNSRRFKSFGFRINGIKMFWKMKSGNKSHFYIIFILRNIIMKMKLIFFGKMIFYLLINLIIKNSLNSIKINYK